MTRLDQCYEHLWVYLELCRCVPSFDPAPGRMEEALKRGDTEVFGRLMCNRLWLLCCHVLEPSFESAYGSPYLYRNFDTGELEDVWTPVIAQLIADKER